MSTNSIIFLKILPGIIGIVSIPATMFLALFVLKSSKKYNAAILQLKEQGKYQEWLERNNGLTISVRVFAALGSLFLLALLMSFAKDFVTVPRPLLVFSHILIYAFYPCIFIAILVYSWLYRKALRDLSKLISAP